MFAADVTLQAVITLDEPIDMAVAPGDDLVWIAERAGRVSRVDLERGEVVETILDIGADTEASGERGLLGIAVTDRWLYANFTDRAGDTRVDAFGRDGTGLGGRRRTILFQSQPFSNHNGGDVAIGPDGFLYVAFGDGGSRGDPLDAGQDPTTWLGAVLRIEPTPDAAEPYAVPADNPLAADPDGAGRPEIFLTGVRNPWRFSFDRVTGDLWLADVGQNDLEEVHLALAPLRGGLNFGWNIMEGSACYPPVVTGCTTESLQIPIAEYGRDNGCSITGGYVYRGHAFPALAGAYIFGDYCSGRVWTLQLDDQGAWQMIQRADFDFLIPTFGEGGDGEIYVTDDAGGRLLRLIAVNEPPSG